MASIINRPEGQRWIQFVDTDGKRQTIRLGKVTAKQAAEVCRRVEELHACKVTGTAFDRDLAGWLAEVDGPLREKLAAVDLLSTASAPRRLGDFLDMYLKGRRDLKRSTLTALGHTRRCLLKFFGPDKLLRDITAGDAEAWRVWLASQANVRDCGRDELSQNTVNRRCGVAKQFFRHAQKRGWIGANPFADLKSRVRGNRARQYFVTLAEIQAAIDAAPNAEWRLILALARFGGLRVPSELLALTWADVDLPGGLMTIRATKTAHHESAGIRTCPIFPELRPYLEDAWTLAPEGAEFVIGRYRDTGANLGTQFRRILRRAGVKPWPKLFHNLRATRQTELLDRFPIKAVCEWLGNSLPVALEHYAQVTTAHFAAATHEPTVSKTPAPEAKQNPKQYAAAGSSNAEKPAHDKAPSALGLTSNHVATSGAKPLPATPVILDKLGAEGLLDSGATPCHSSQLRQGRKVGEAESEAVVADSAAVDPDLARLVETWPGLPEAVRKQVLDLIVEATNTTSSRR